MAQLSSATSRMRSRIDFSSALRNDRSMEDEILDILHCVVEEEALSAGGLGTDISCLFAEVGLEADIPELRGGDCLKATGDDARHSTNNSL
jgi:hypothetical protein